MQIELQILTSQPLTAPPLIADVESCNLIFINADCFDHSVAILGGSLRAPYRRLAVTAIRNTLGTECSSLPQHTVSTGGAGQALEHGQGAYCSYSSCSCSAPFQL